MHKRLQPIAIALLAGVFAFAGFSKLIDPLGMDRALAPWADHYPRSVFMIESGLPLIEIMLAIGILFRKTRKVTTWGCLIALIFFIGFLMTLRSFGFTACGCFGAGVAEGPVASIGRDVGLILIATFVLQGIEKEEHVHA
jgi:uncharacterized membrane protein